MTDRNVDNYVEIGDLSDNLIEYLKNSTRYPQL